MNILMFRKDDRKAEEKFMREVMQTADKRPPLPQEDLNSIKHAARAVWQQRYADRVSGFRARPWMLPVAAALFGGLVLTWWALRPPAALPPPALVAHVDRVSGTVIASDTRAGEPVVVAAGQPLRIGSLVQTDQQSRVALQLTGLQSLRLDRGTQVRFLSATIVTLDRGAVYLDSSSPSEVTIRTASGDFQPIGTQFEVRRNADTYLRVREGRVRLQRLGEVVTATEGEGLIVHQDGSIVRSRLAPDDPSWDWAAETAPVLDIEGRSLRAFLDWVAREKGWKVKYTSEEAASLSNTTILHGSISHLAPSEALRTVALSSGVDYRISEGILIVGAD